MTAAAESAAAAAATTVLAAVIPLSGGDTRSSVLPPHASTSSTSTSTPTASASASSSSSSSSSSHPPVSPVARRVCTPLSLFLNSAKPSTSGRLSNAHDDDDDDDAAAAAATVRERYLKMPPSAVRPAAGASALSPAVAAPAVIQDNAAAAVVAAADGAPVLSLSLPLVSLPASAAPACAGVAQHGILSGGVISAPLFQRGSARARGQQQHDDHHHRHHHPRNSVARGPVPNVTTAAAAAALSLSPGRAAGLPHEDPPLRTGSVQPDTALVHPKPILRAAADSNVIFIKHPIPDLPARSASALSNIAQLEATAERLSMTSSIDDAIRDLHGALKRSDSRRSSILAASIRAASADETSASATVLLRRHPSTSSSAAVARHRGYSPAAYVMSPSNSLTGRMRSGSKTSTGRPDYDVADSILSRHGPGKSSVRSVRSAKPSLAEISESEPISLTQHVLDEADAAPPIERENNVVGTRRMQEQDAVAETNTDALSHMLEGGFHDAGPDLTLANPEEHHYYQENPGERPATANSNSTFQQAQDAFIDFDGVHCPDDGQGTLPGMDLEAPTPKSPSADVARPQSSYFDQRTGQHMLYYPARVPAMLNLPPKLSNKPKAAQRNQRRSQILSVMMEGKGAPASSDKRQSVLPDMEKSWLPDPLSGHRNSFAALSTDQLREALAPVQPDEPTPQPEPEPELRRPQRLSEMDADKRKSKVPQLDNIPSHLRASVFFDLPSEIPEIQIKDGSAMATLDSILDASANAPVSAFTDHVFAGKLGSEVYGRERKHKSHASVPTLSVSAIESQPKKRSSVMLLSKRSNSSYNSLNKGPNSSNPSMQSAINGNGGHHITEDNVIRVGIEPNGARSVQPEEEQQQHQEEEEEEEEEEVYQGPPTTLLAELQIRKQQQKQRVRNPVQAFPEGMRATLLEMDAVAETQRKQRQSQRVTLAWEEQDAHVDHNASDDEDVPLAVIAAMQQGAKNLADLERPLGLMEMREMEDNEPLSHRQARLQGRESAMFAKRQSVLSLPATRMMEVQPPVPLAIVPPSAAPAEEKGEEEHEDETLGARKRRLTQLPKARPVSSSFSAELLSQFGDLDEPKETRGKPLSKGMSLNPEGEEETLGQRRRRLQAEREAREREMSYSNLVGEPAKKPTRRLSMADVLAVHQQREPNQRALEERRRLEEQQRLAEQEARMAAMRGQMPTLLAEPGSNRNNGGFRGGVYNDGLGGRGAEAAKSSPALHLQTFNAPNNRKSMVVAGNYGAAMRGPNRQSSYSSLNVGPGAMNSAGYNGMNGGMYGGAYGGMLQPGVAMPMTTSNASMDRVERWRQSVLP